MGIYHCENCKKEFNAREADRKRGWARFCSKSCKAVKQEKRTGQMSAYLLRGYRGPSSNNHASRKDDGGFGWEEYCDSLHPFDSEALGQW